MSDKGSVKHFAASIAALKVEAAFTDIRSVGDSHETRIEPQSGETPRIHIWHEAVLITAETFDNARESAIGTALEKWPESDGYYGHSANVSEIPLAVIEGMLSGSPPA